MCWGSIFKALRLIGPDEVQGKIMGFYYGANGIGYVIVNLILSEVCDHFSKNKPCIRNEVSLLYTWGIGNSCRNSSLFSFKYSIKEIRE